MIIGEYIKIKIYSSLVLTQITCNFTQHGNCSILFFFEIVGQTSSEMFFIGDSVSSVFSRLLLVTASWEDEFSQTWFSLNWREFEAWKVGRLLSNKSHSFIASVQLRRGERGLQHWWWWWVQPSEQSRSRIKDTDTEVNFTNLGMTTTFDEEKIQYANMPKSEKSSR